MNRYILVKAGIDVNQGVHRFNENKEMYEEFLMKFPQDKCFGNLEDAIQKKDIKKAFEASHSLKGISGNLSLVQLHADLIPLVEGLRAGSMDNVEELMIPIRSSYKQVMDALTRPVQPTKNNLF